jgi:hypothetical protein
MTIRLFVVLITLINTVAAIAQPVFTSTEFTSIYLKNVTQLTHQINTIDTVNLTALAGISGENKTWDFRTISISAQSDHQPDSVIPFLSSMPFASEFPTATYAQVYSSNGLTHYSYNAINDNGYFILGSALDTIGGGSALSSKYNPPFRFFALPATYQTSWTNASTYTGGDTSSHEIDSVQGLVDGWGVLYVPGSNVPDPCLRSKLTSIYLNSSPTHGDTSIQTSYIWFSASGITITADIGTAGRIYSAAIAIPIGANAVDPNTDLLAPQITILNNPVSDKAQVLIRMARESQASIYLIDIMGKQTTILHQGRLAEGLNNIQLDASPLSNGTYFLHIESPELTATRKIIVGH